MFFRFTGWALILGGLLTLLINVILTPQMDLDGSYAEIAGSMIFLVRLSAAFAAALLLLFGSAGLYAAQAERSGRFGFVMFILAFTGTAALLANEWASVFVIHPVALASPEALEGLEDSVLFDIGVAALLALFVLGWIGMAVSTLRTGSFPKWAAISVIAGLVLAMALPAAIGVWGMSIANTVFGAGLMGLGWRVAGKGQG
jgi:hypothetical protein